jgi:hypothetical protein
MANDENYTNCEVSVGQSPWAIQPTVQTKKWHTVTIDKVENGFIVKVGCKTFVDNYWSSITQRLSEYWDDPIAAENKYCGDKK